MKKLEFDFLVIDQIYGLKYEKTLRCKFDSNIGQLIKTLQKKTKKNIMLTYNNITLTKEMRLREIFSRFCQNQIQIQEENEPIPEMIVRHSIQFKQLMRQRKLEEIEDAAEPENNIEDTKRNKAKSQDFQIGAGATQTSDSCQNCVMIKQVLNNYENTIEGLIKENQNLQEQIEVLVKEKKNLENKSFKNNQSKIKSRS